MKVAGSIPVNDNTCFSHLAANESDIVVRREKQEFLGVPSCWSIGGAGSVSNLRTPFKALAIRR